MRYKYAAQISYLGTGYAGWQRQFETIGVQQRLEEAIANLGECCSVTGAGRTDAGVHALGQIASFSLNKDWETRRLLLALNAHLPEDIRVMKVFRANDGFDARRSALWREYRYFIYHGTSCLAPIRQFVWWNRYEWDIEKVSFACKEFIGKHDFKAFCKTTECPDNSMRNMLRVSCKKLGRLSMIQVRGESFLNNMVRIIVGTLDRIGRGEQPAEWIRDLLSGKQDRKDAGMTVPASGLFFWKVGYKCSELISE